MQIYKGLANGDSVKNIHKKLMDETIHQKKQGLATSDAMLKVALASTNKLKKKIGNKSFVEGYVKTTYGSQVESASLLELTSIFVFDLIDKNKIEKKLSHEITEEADKKEGDSKKRAIAENIQNNRSMAVPKIFYLASQHKDSASDHKDYQGKMYIDEKWKSVIDDKDLQMQISKYINEHNIKTIQWVTGEPVWFITRPNCRHYFKEMDTADVLGTSRTKLLKQNEMDSAIGDRQYLQTIKHSTSKEWYQDIRNAQLLLEKYKERLDLHQSLYETMPNKILKNAIAKDKMLINKWQKYIESKK